MKKSNKEFYEEKFIEEIEKMDRALKKSVKKSFIRAILVTLPILSLLILPKSLLVIGIAISSCLVAVAKILTDKEELKEEEELNKQIDRFGTNIVETVNDMFAKETNYNKLKNPVEYENFKEQFLAFLECLLEQGMINVKEIQNNNIDMEAINSFLFDIKHTAGTDLKIIPTVDFIQDLVSKTLGIKSNLRPVAYLYDNNNFYLYSKKKDNFMILPLPNEEMYKIFDSNKDNYENRLLVQLMEEKFGPLNLDNIFRL